MSAMDRITPARLYLLTLLTLLVLVHGFFPGVFRVDGMTVSMLGILVVVVLAPLLESVTLPGGTGLKFREQVDKLGEESQRAQIEQKDVPPLRLRPVDEIKSSEVIEEEIETSASPLRVRPRDKIKPADMSDEEPIDIILPEPAPQGARFSPKKKTADELVAHVLLEASRSPTIGVMILTTELEQVVRDILLTTGWATPDSQRSLRGGVARLVELGVLTPSAASALDLFVSVRDDIVHGRLSRSEADILRVVDDGIILLRSILAIPRERNVVAHVNVPLYIDAKARELLSVVKGLILETLSTEDKSVSYRIFPTRRIDYVVGKEVTWEWHSKQWGPAWYRDPDSGEPKKAWDASLEFAGRHLD